MFRNVKELVELATSQNKKISEVMISQEVEVTGRIREEVIAQMERNLEVMEQALEKGLSGVRSHSGLTGGDAVLLQEYMKKGNVLSGETVLDAVSKAVATNEVNAAMGKICATPTAGSAGVVPGTLFAVKEKLNPTREQMVQFLFTAGAFGFVVANNASISGAAGGCQAEIGSAAGMAAAAIVEMAGGTPEQSAEAMAITLKNMLGLVCDPVAGLVEVPCVKRNAMGAANAMVAADMALAGIKSRIPCDEVIEAMYRIGQTMPTALKETAQGGLAATPTGRELERKIFGFRSKMVSNLLQAPVEQIKGIGEETASQLNEMSIYTVEDLLMFFPYRYEDYRLRDLAEVKHEEKVTIEGKIHSEVLLTYYGRKKSRLSFRVLVGRYLITAICFNRPYYKGKLSLNDIVTITGKWDQHRQTITVNELTIGPITKNNVIEPVYSTKGKITVKGMRRFVSLALKQYEDHIVENLPTPILQRYKLLPKKEAIRFIHQPIQHNDLKQARRRFVYEEFLYFQLKMQALRKFEREQSQGASQHFSEELLSNFIAQLPFPLTKAQNRVLHEILSDMKSPFRMNRLLQGDVGSGKTVVAAIALYATVLAGHQGALMVPTEILAEQHASSLKSLFANTNVNIQLLTSSVKGKTRKEILHQLETGETQIIVGTHALIQSEVNFKKLGLVITDEQHRFGVEQRRVLREKGEQPDVLFMTATPIPRTLAITAFGEMDVSVIDEMPAGRKVIETYWAKPEMLERILAFVEKELVKGRQAYVICPLIEESEKLDVQNAIDVHAMLSNYYGQKWNVGLMHGRLTSDEKDSVMKQFSENEVQVLVSTTVVEVGVNVPNATIMVIYDAERFGLSQLHQLRGRVGRGTEQSYCILLADPKSEVGKERMRIMTETNDGFVLSEKDLELRGPGDFFGKKQSGVPEFKVADMVHDYRALEVARDDATKLISSESFWKDPMYEHLRNSIIESRILDGEKLD